MLTARRDSSTTDFCCLLCVLSHCSLSTCQLATIRNYVKLIISASLESAASRWIAIEAKNETELVHKLARAPRESERAKSEVIYGDFQPIINTTKKE